MFKQILIIAVTLFTFSLPTLASAKPNIIVILTDDQGFGDISIHGNKDLSTPNIDSLGHQGATFHNFYVCPVCSPTRAEFLTGRYHFRSGVYSTSAGGERIDLDETTIADTFKAAGYQTAAYGKWHSGMQYPYHPNGRGFDDFYGFASGHWGNYFSPMLEHNGQIVKGAGFLVDDLTTHAINFIEKNKSNPFFLYLPLNTPHSPMQVPDPYWNKQNNKKLIMPHPDKNPNRGKGPQFTKAALAMCENIDHNVGRILKKLNDTHLTQNTIILYFSDNGPNSNRWNLGMKGTKGSTDEGGTRSPLLMRWPAKIQPGTQVHQVAAAIDLLPTLTAMAGIKPTSAKPLDGLNLTSQITNAKSQIIDRTLFLNWKNKFAIRSQNFRLDNNGKLYNITHDRTQKKDLAKQHPDIHAQLTAALNNFKKQHAAELPKVDPRGFLVGHPDATYTQIPARDGIPRGNIKRSNRFPNCSYFTNWKTKDDAITFDIEVVQDGLFEVQFFYTCPKADIGSTIHLTFNGNTTQAKITKPHNPPPAGMEHDRIKRAESYIKDFIPMSLGQINLKKGKGTLTLSASNIPNKQVADFRLLLLKRIK